MRQSSAHQVLHNRESGALQYAMRDRLTALGFIEIEVIDEDLGRSAAGGVQRAGFERMVAEVCLGKVGAVRAREVSRFARNTRDWQQLIEMCRVVDTVLVDQETIYAPRHGNDRLLLGLKGSLNEYELDLLRQRSLSARYAKARRGDSSWRRRSFRKGRRPLREDLDRRVQAAISLVFDKIEELGARDRRCSGSMSRTSISSEQYERRDELRAELRQLPHRMVETQSTAAHVRKTTVATGYGAKGASARDPPQGARRLARAEARGHGTDGDASWERFEAIRTMV